MIYEEWQNREELSPSSPEAVYSELAWNAAIKEMRKIIIATQEAENTIGNLIVLQLEELEHLDTGLGTSDVDQS